MSMDLTTLARVRNVLGFTDDDVARDAELARLIKAVSADFESSMRRKTQVAEYTEILPVWYPARILSLSAVPVLDTPTAIAIKGSNVRDFVTGPVTMTRGVDFILENENGRVRFLLALRGITDNLTGRVLSPAYFQCIYTGGMAETTAEFMQSYADIAEAAELQTCYLFQRQKDPAGNLRVGNASTDYGDRYVTKAFDYLPWVSQILESYKLRSIF